MSVAYVDTSALVSIAFNERGGTSLARRLDNFSHLLSSNLLEAELRAVFAREEIDFTTSLVSGIEWVLPDRPLTSELKMALKAGYLRGADLWHVATALYVVREPSDISFVTLDIQQRAVVKALGFQT